MSRANTKAIPKILPSLLKINLFSFLAILATFIMMNLYLGLMMHRYDRVSNYIHDYADLTQYATTLVSRFNNSLKNKDGELENIKKLINDFALDTGMRLKKRRAIFLTIYNQSELEEFESNLNVLKNLYIEIQQEKNLDKKIEQSYVQVLKFSSNHDERIGRAFIKNILIALFTLFIFMGIVIYALIKKIRDVLLPLKELTTISEKLSITDEKIDLNLNYRYYEYKVLALSFRNMYQRIHYENKVISDESASSIMSHFVENIAHVINNPLATIATSLTLLKKKFNKTGDNETLNEIAICLSEIGQISETTRKMKSLIDTTSKTEAEYFYFSNLVTLINLLFFNRFMEKGIKFNYPTEDFKVFGKEYVIGNILMTLIENSIQYNTEKEPVINLTVDMGDDSIEVKVHDNGEILASVEVYKYFLGEGSSSSYGLYSSRVLAEENGYSLFYNESPQKEFVLKLPLQKGDDSTSGK